jgi:hypothetical protein
MRLITLILLLLATFFNLSAQSPDNNLYGLVTDSTSNRPLSGVSIFLNNTSKGTVSLTDGSFLLKAIPRNKYQLILSAIGYQTAVIDINGDHLPSSLKVSLRQKVTELKAYVVEPEDKRGWQNWGRTFVDNFIGTTENAQSCTIRNTGTLHFYFYKKRNRLTVSASEPLVIENAALGYILQYKLESFSIDFNTNVVVYSGYPYFLAMTTTNEGRRRRWEARREKVYAGSVMHFMRSLYADRLQQEKFVVKQEMKLPNAEKRRVQKCFRPDSLLSGVYSPDTLHYYLETLRQPDFETRVINATAGSLLVTLPDTSEMARDLKSNNAKPFSFDDSLAISYPTWEFKSQLRLVNTDIFVAAEDGSYFPPGSIRIYGAWSRSEKIANLLPLDYGKN